MIEKKRTRHFHAGKLRKTVGGIEFVEVAESKGKVFVSNTGLVLTPRSPAPTRGQENNVGYRHIGMHSKNVRFDAYVHRLVFEVFVGEIPDGLEIDHFNCDKSDNRLSNLQVVSHRENIIGNPRTRKLHRQSASVNAKRACELNKVPVRAIDEGGFDTVYRSIDEASVATGTNRCSISRVLHGYQKTAGGYKWEVCNER